jgi:MEMO1 family protein
MSVHPVRPPAVAGRFYPNAPDKLRAEVDAYINSASDYGIGDQIVALVAPHAGYMYSGATAAQAFRQVQGVGYDVVIVVAPSHSEAFPGVSIMSDGAYETPLGPLTIHTEVARNIIEQADIVRPMDRGHQSEHAIEVELPFLQRTLGDIPFVPLVMANRSAKTCETLARAISEATTGLNALVIASSDLYHGYSVSECKQADDRTLCYAVDASSSEFRERLEAGDVEACGGGPIAVVKEYARLSSASGAMLLARTNSAEATGSSGGYVVGYAAIAYYRSDNDTDADQSEVTTRREKQAMLGLARSAVEAAVHDTDSPSVPADAVMSRTDCGAFVTLHVTVGGNRTLRGCIGQMLGDRPLGDIIVTMAESAALRDNRFDPVGEGELGRIDIEISVLSPLRTVQSPDEVVVGVHGVLVTGRGSCGYRGYRGVLLPQVATENGWNREKLLSQTCLKAGLPASAWRGGDVDIEVFTAEVFGELRAEVG